MQVYIINGPNLNLLGSREPELYGQISFLDFLKGLETQYPEINITYVQENEEHHIIRAIHDAGAKQVDGIILNAGAYTHTSLAIADALRGVKPKTVEVHISHVYAREKFRHLSKISASCVGSISGLGLSGYRLALEYLLEISRV